MTIPDSILAIQISIFAIVLTVAACSTDENEAVIPETGGDFIAAHTIPFSWKTYFRAGAMGDIYIGKSDSLRIERYDTEGRLTGVIKNLINPQPVLQAELDRASENEIISGHVPDYHPAFIDFHVDNRDQFWFNISKVTEEESRWVALDEDGTPVKYVALPYRFRVQQIRDGLVYGIQRLEDGRQKIVVYYTG